MTNKEKYKQVFGFDTDETWCPALSCEECPINSELIDPRDCNVLMREKWWNSEYIKPNKEG